ncbi:MAG TPA: aspartate--tRNA(Asn) ligase [Roseiflexaceae bacterium]|nr:aspartate--tRNA(Asn) ligase [Roseiflexaceae bacterium]HMP39718.1 aspartate--tRNA(Asn) ligase [Roseiflexaceae bacterium]
MERIWTTQLGSYAGQRVRMAGWLHRLRTLSHVSFLILRDGQGTAQVVLDDPLLAAQMAELPAETVLEIKGLAVAEPQAPGGVEVHDPVIRVIAEAAEPPPFDLYRPTLKAQLPTILDNAPLALRHPRQRALFRLAAASMAGFRATLQAQDFTEIQTPKLVASATEGGANVFTVDYFGRSAYLAQSPQFYKQIMVGIFERVFEVGPVFRAEPHDTPRHLNEYVSLDVEIGFIDDHTTVMALLEQVLAGMLQAIREQAADALALLHPRLPDSTIPFPRIHFRDALEMISTAIGEDVRGEPDLAPAHERWLGEWARAQYGSDFLFVWGYPLAKRPFYTHPDPQRPGYSNGFDLLFRGLELVTGGQRLHRYDDYMAVLAARNLDPAPFREYLQAFRHGMPPHGGFAIGLERWVARLIEAPNIRETTLFPRDMQRLTP